LEKVTVTPMLQRCAMPKPVGSQPLSYHQPQPGLKDAMAAKLEPRVFQGWLTRQEIDTKSNKADDHHS